MFCLGNAFLESGDGEVLKVSDDVQKKLDDLKAVKDAEIEQVSL